MDVPRDFVQNLSYKNIKLRQITGSQPQSDFEVNVRGSPDRFDFYCPIHDAAYLGQKDAVPWWHIWFF